ncbi:hypothetical protein [Ornithinimicrobium kibberense]|uniref:hypothetical protein n=1 Tax=Ornithinimicrobium kibberense TaxID=282060 RepID=UPI003622D86C
MAPSHDAPVRIEQGRADRDPALKQAGLCLGQSDLQPLTVTSSQARLRDAFFLTHSQPPPRASPSTPCGA